MEEISLLQLQCQLAWAERLYGKGPVYWEIKRQIAEAQSKQLSFLPTEQMELPCVLDD